MGLLFIACWTAGTETDQAARWNQAAEFKWSSENKLILL